MSDHFRKLENMYHAAPVSSYYSPKLEVDDGRAVIYRHGVGQFMGG